MTTTGMARAGDRFSRSTTSNPSSFGILISSSTTSGAWRGSRPAYRPLPNTYSSASSPSFTQCASSASSRRAASARSASPVSSSTSRTRTELRAREAATNGELDEGGQVLEAELGHEPAAIGVDALRREAEAQRHLAARIALDDELQYLQLARAQTLERVFVCVVVNHRHTIKGGQPRIFSSDKEAKHSVAACAFTHTFRPIPCA